MPAALSVLTITDGTTTATLTDTAKYGLLADGWAPQVAARRTSVLGGRPYASTTEEIRLNVYGTTMANAFANLAIIAQLIDQADRWYRGEAVAPVRIEYLPQGSILAATVRTLVFGFAGDAGPVALPGNFNDRLMLYEISDVSIRFVRDGAWYGTEEFLVTGTAPLTSVNSGPFTNSATHLSPVKVEIGPLPESGTIPAYDTGYLLLADRAARLQVIEAEAAMAFGSFTTDADAAREPSGTGVLVYTPPDTLENFSMIASVSLGTPRYVGIVAAIRNSHATTTFQVRVELNGSHGPSSVSQGSTRPYFVDASTTDPRIVLLGVVTCNDDPVAIRVLVQASAAAGTLSIDYFALINLDDPTSRIVAIGPISIVDGIPSPHESKLTIDPQPLTSRTPRVRQIDYASGSTNYAIVEWYRGDAFLLSLGTDIAAVYCGRNASGGYWRVWDGVAAQTATITFTRWPAYLAPQ